MGTDSFKFKAFTHWHIGCIYQIWTCEWTCLMGSYGNWKPQCRTHCLSRLSEGYRYVHEPWTMNHEPWYSLFERSAIKTCSGVREWGKRVGSHVAVNTNYVHIGRYLQCLETSDSGRYTYLPIPKCCTRLCQTSRRTMTSVSKGCVVFVYRTTQWFLNNWTIYNNYPLYIFCS